MRLTRVRLSTSPGPRLGHRHPLQEDVADSRSLRRPPHRFSHRLRSSPPHGTGWGRLPGQRRTDTGRTTGDEAIDPGRPPPKSVQPHLPRDEPIFNLADAELLPTAAPNGHVCRYIAGRCCHSSQSPGMLLMCDFDTGFKPPEMVKVRTRCGHIAGAEEVKSSAVHRRTAEFCCSATSGAISLSDTSAVLAAHSSAPTRNLGEV